MDLVEMKVERAKELLATRDDLRFEDIARKLKYSPSHFGHIFKRATGLNAREWRRR